MDDNKVTVSIRIDASMMAQLRADAKDENRSLSNYLETLLYRIGYRPMNGGVDTSSTEAMRASILGDRVDE